MLANFSDLFDVLLIIAGLALVVTGMVMFIRSKSSTDASSVEAFGIKLNVTHPSLILVLAGVGLMLAPRLLPEPPGKTGKPEPAIEAEAPQTTPPTPAPSIPTLSNPMPPPTESSTPAPSAPSITVPASAAPTIQPTRVPTPSPVTSRPASPSPRPVAKPTVSSAPVSSKSPPAPSPPPKLQAAPSSAASSPLASLRPAPTVSPAPKPLDSAAPTAAVPKPARPILAFAALGLPTYRDFWRGETRTGYTRRLHTSLQQTGRDVLRMEPRNMDLGQAAFEAWWDESGQHSRSKEYCAAPNAPRALLAARVETPYTNSSIESAYWPELKLRLYNCANQRVYRQQKTLSPQNNDAWPFASELNSEIERFMRTYRGDLEE